MNKITLLFLLSTFFLACSTDESGTTSPVITQQAIIGQNPIKQLYHSFDVWEEGGADDVFSRYIDQGESFSFTKNFFEETINNESVDAYKFVLGVKHNKMQIVCMGVTDEGKLTSPMFETGTLNTNAINLQGINENQNQYFNVSNIEDLDIKKHILQIKDAIEYLNDWNSIFNNSSDLEEFISYDGVRIKHFSIDKEAIQFLINRSNVSEIELVLGLNSDQKMTPMFFGKNGKTVIFDREAINFSLGYTSPCINNCETR